MKQYMTSLRKNEACTAIAFVAPFVLGVLIFSIIPIFYSFYISVMDFNSISSFTNLKFIGIENYMRVFQDETARMAFVKSFEFSLIYVPGIMILSLLMAILMNNSFYFKKFTRSMILMPYVSNVVAIAIVWSVILNPYDGPVNFFIKSIGTEDPPMWLAGMDSALPIAALIYVWQNLAFQTIVFLAAIQEVPTELYESAKVDGANAWQKFTRITFPFISPTTFFLVISTIIGSTQNFAIIQNLTGGGPADSSEVVAVNIYKTAFEFNKYSVASAESVIMFVILIIITILQWKGQKKWVNYR